MDFIDVADWVAAYGVWGLALAAFLGATLVPISSEVAFVVALEAGMAPLEVFAAASAGNALGALSTYGIGRLFAPRAEARLQQNRAGRRALAWSTRYGRWSLLGSPLPVIGDPLCLAAGLMGIKLAFFVAVGIGTRLARYGVLLWVFSGI